MQLHLMLLYIRIRKGVQELRKPCFVFDIETSHLFSIM
jgi:hypothetical protein